MRLQRLSAVLAVLAVSASAMLGIVGCGGEKPSGGTTAGAKADQHAHPSKGPHGGPLIELGKEEYHVEMVHDDAAGVVTFYVLDGKAEKAVPIPAIEVIVNLKHDGKPEQFKIPAQADTKDPAGNSSRFVSNDKELAEDLDHEGADAELVISIGDKQYRGKLAHDHEGEAKK